MAPQTVIDGLNLDRLQQPRQVGLPSIWISPDLSDHCAVATKVESRLLGSAQPKDGLAFSTVGGDQRPSVQDQGTHAAGSLVDGLGNPRSAEALANSSAVKTPCSSANYADLSKPPEQGPCQARNMTKLFPKLVVTGADEAIAFYTQVFGARLVQRYTAGDTVVYALLALLGGQVSLKEADEHDPSPTTLGRPGVLMDVTVDDPDRLAQAVLNAGGTTVFPVNDQPYGARGGRVRDPFGHEWLLQTEIPLSEAEVQQRMDAMTG